MTFSKPCISILSIALFLSSCFKLGGPCEEPIRIYDAGIGITFKNNAGHYLYRERFPIYDVDSLEITDQYGHLLKQYRQQAQIPDSPFFYNEIQLSGIYNDSTDKNVFDAEVCKKIYIRYYHNNVDSIKVCFKAAKRKCGSNFDYFNIYYKDQLLLATRNTVFAQMELINH